MTRADTIARHLNQAGEHLSRNCIDAAMRCINAAFLECLGGAAVAGEAAGIAVEGGGPVEITDCVGVGDNRPVSTPSPPKPAGWVVRATHEDGRTLWASNAGSAHSESMGCAHVFLSAGGLLEREEKKWGPGWSLTVLPVDGAGNVIEALPGVAWEAARAGEDVERLRAELAAVKAERDAAKREEALSREGERIAVAERDALAAEVQRSREQQPVRWAVVNPYDAIVCIYTEVDLAKRHSTASGYRLAPLYLAPVVRDHSGVIAQCEEALRAWDRDDVRCRAGALMAIATTAAIATLKGDAK